MLSEPVQVALKIIEVVDHLGIPYLIGGSLASAVHGVVRSMDDLRKRAKSLGVEDLLERSLREVGITR